MRRGRVPLGVLVLLLSTGCGRATVGAGPHSPTTASGLTPAATKSAPIPAGTPTSSATVVASPPDVVPPAGVAGATLLQAPTSPLVGTLEPASGCASLADRGWVANCGQVTTTAGPVTWVVETDPPAAWCSPWCYPKRAYVFVPGPGLQWHLALVYADDSGASDYVVTATTVSLPSGANDLVVAVRSTGSGAAVSLDIVSGPAVVAHAGEYDTGYATIGPSRVDLFGRVADTPTEAHAAWQLREHDALEFVGGRWAFTKSTSPTPLPYPSPYPGFPEFPASG